MDRHPRRGYLRAAAGAARAGDVSLDFRDARSWRGGLSRDAEVGGA
jgi:hypothetical protein